MVRPRLDILSNDSQGLIQYKASEKTSGERSLAVSTLYCIKTLPRTTRLRRKAARSTPMEWRTSKVDRLLGRLVSFTIIRFQPRLNW